MTTFGADGWPRYFDEHLETLNPSQLATLERALLTEQIEACYHSMPFYRRKLDRAGVGPTDVRDIQTLGQVPFTSKEEIRHGEDENGIFGDRGGAALQDVVRVHMTSGTTGRPVLTGYTRHDVEMSAALGARAFWACGVRPFDVIAHCLSYGFYTGGVSDHLGLEATGAAVVPVGLGQTSRLLDTWNEVKPSALFSTVTYPLYLAEHAVEGGMRTTEAGIHKLVVTGEPGGQLQATRARLEELWDAEVCDSYGISDIWGTFAGECTYRDGLHFLGHGAVIAELIDPRTEQSLDVSPGATGELVFTHLQREATPLIRFRSHDCVEIIERGCRCGRTGFRFRVIGRTDDMFRVRGVNVFPSAIGAIVSEFGCGRFAVVLDKFPIEPPVTVLVDGIAGAEDRLAQAIRRRLGFGCDVLHATLPTQEGKATLLYRLYMGETLPPKFEFRGGNRSGQPDGSPR
jgi:phenylacetate-CoA ligase